MGNTPHRPQRSLLVWRAGDNSGDTPATILLAVIERLKTENRLEPDREISLAIQRCQEGLHWIRDVEEKRSK
jgi:hypothetical protein